MILDYVKIVTELKSNFVKISFKLYKLKRNMKEYSSNYSISYQIMISSD
jgi:hypothetical protein